MNTPFVSVIIPTRDPSGILTAALGLVRYAALIYAQAEILVVDAGSVNGSCDQLPADILVVHAARCTLVEAANEGLTHASGDLTLFLEECRFVYPSLVRLHAKAHATRPVITCGNVERCELVQLFDTRAVLEPGQSLRPATKRLGALVASLLEAGKPPEGGDVAAPWSGAGVDAGEAWRHIDPGNFCLPTSLLRQAGGLDDRCVTMDVAAAALARQLAPIAPLLHLPTAATVAPYRPAEKGYADALRGDLWAMSMV